MRDTSVLKVVMVLFRAVLGLFVSSALGFGLYVISLPVVLSIWGYGGSVVVLLILATSIGAGIGSYITWFERDFKVSTHALLLAVALGCAVMGAWLGLLRGIDVAVFHPIWKAGNPEIAVPVMGAVIAANIPLLVLGLYRAIKDPRL